MDEASKTALDSALLGRYLAGEASPEEVILLEDWMAMSAANRLLFEQYLQTWNGVEPGTSYQIPDKSAAWRKLRSATQSKPSGKVINLFRSYSVAAVIAGLALLSIIPIIYFNRNEDTGGNRSITVTTDGQVQRSTFPDGSSIILNNNSSIQFAAEFAPNQRTAVLNGEAYFDIVPDPSRPFVISFEEVKIMVLGTSFNIRKNISQNTIETQVSSGQVRMFNENGEISIAAGQTGIYRKAQNSFALQQRIDVNSVSYATRNFVFADESLANIIQYLGKAYSKKIVLRPLSIGRCKMTSSFNNKSIEYILDVISATLNVKYTIHGDTIYIEGGEHEGC